MKSITFFFVSKLLQPIGSYFSTHMYFAETNREQLLTGLVIIYQH